MNYLAHAVLSGRDYEILAGNLLADQIKGEPPAGLPERVRQGVVLHRRLDSFTDNHAVFRSSRSRLRGTFGHYSGVVVDVVYDHFLAHHIEVYTGQTLPDFATWADSCFRKCSETIPEALHPRWTGLLWLQEYAEVKGIERAFSRISARARRRVDFSRAVEFLDGHWEGLEADFLKFFPEVIVVEKQYLSEIGLSV